MQIDLSILARHERIAFSYSGGKDSTAVWHMLRNAGVLDRVTVYHTDTGDLLPEMRDVVSFYEAQTPHFVRIQKDVHAWIAENGLPTDLLPHSAHWAGQEMGEARIKLVGRYDCCFANLMLPTYERIVADGNTLLIRGTKAVDMRRLPCGTGDVLNGIEFYYPLQYATHEEVFAYLAEQGARICRVYEHTTNAPECATCSAWWGERRAEYLKRHHPELFRKYAARLRAVVAELEPVVGTLLPEMAATQDEGNGNG